MELLLDLFRTSVRLKIFGRDRVIPLGLILLVIFSTVTILFTRHILLQDKWQTLEVKWHGYSIEYPALWSTQTYAASGGRGKNLDYLSASVDSFGLYVFIHQMTMDKADLTVAFAWWQEIIHEWGLSNISSPVETQIGYDNYPAIMQSYYRGSELVYAYYVVSDNRSYLIEFKRVSEDSQPIVDQMLASFRLIEEGDD